MALLGTILYVAAVICTIWVIYKLFAFASNQKLSTRTKIIWFIIAITLSIITAIIYYFVYRK